RDRAFGLVAERNSQAQRQEQGEDENPEHDFGLALQLQHARHQEMGVAGPATVAALRGRSRRLSPDWSFLGYAHREPLALYSVLEHPGRGVRGYTFNFINLRAGGGLSAARIHLPGSPAAWSDVAICRLASRSLPAGREWSDAVVSRSTQSGHRLREQTPRWANCATHPVRRHRHCRQQEI